MPKVWRRRLVARSHWPLAAGPPAVRVEIDFSEAAARSGREALGRASAVLRRRADGTLHGEEAIGAFDAAVAAAVPDVDSAQVRIRLGPDAVPAAVRVQARLFDWRMR